jgi:hypothetical protein
MLPPVLEVYVVWHPADVEGSKIASLLMSHFRGTPFSGLIGGAVEVYVRSASDSGIPDEAPRPLPPAAPLPYGLAQPALTAVVLVAGQSLAADVQSDGAWRAYVEEIATARDADPERVGLFTVGTHGQALDGTTLGDLVGNLQVVAHESFGTPEFEATLTRDLAQGIVQTSPVGPKRVTAFVSHTKWMSPVEEAGKSPLLDLVRDVIASTKLRDFLDAHDLQPNTDWAAELRAAASTGALLAVRTDLYSSRPWCQTEVLTAKQAGMPVVVLDALSSGEERGSFLMDHVPRVPGRQDDELLWRREDIVRSLGALVDECLKRVLWTIQESEAVAHGLPVDVDWWAPHAPEPATFTDWLEHRGVDSVKDQPVVILHPDPPLGESEVAVLRQLARLLRMDEHLSFLTPRGLAARGG